MQDRTLDGDAPHGTSSHGELAAALESDEPAGETIRQETSDASPEVGRLAQEIKRLSEQLVRESQKGSQPFRAAGYRWLPRGA